MFFFSKDNITAKPESEIEQELIKKKKQEQEQTKVFYEKIKQKMNTKEQFQNDFQNQVNKYSNEEKLSFNAVYEMKDYIDSDQQQSGDKLSSIKSLALYTKYLTFGVDRLNCDESSLDLLRKFILDKFGKKLDALYVKFNFDSHDSQWNNRKKTIQLVNTQWDETFEKIIPIYRCDYQFQGLIA